MTSCITEKVDLLSKHYTRINPGPVGTVGDALMSSRLPQSNPDMPIRYDGTFHGRNGKRLGTAITDGTHTSFLTGAGPARVYDDKIQRGHSGFKRCHGWTHQDLRPADRLAMPTLVSTGNMSWRDKVGNVVNAFRTGELFDPLPSEYNLPLGELPRGGLVPRITDSTQGGLAIEYEKLRKMIMDEKQVKEPVKKISYSEAATQTDDKRNVRKPIPVPEPKSKVR